VKKITFVSVDGIQKKKTIKHFEKPEQLGFFKEVGTVKSPPGSQPKNDNEMGSCQVRRRNWEDGQS
jgi:hypothetical protein